MQENMTASMARMAEEHAKSAERQAEQFQTLLRTQGKDAADQMNKIVDQMNKQSADMLSYLKDSSKQNADAVAKMVEAIKNIPPPQVHVQSSGCFDSESMISLADGSKKLISEVKVGDKVFSWQKSKLTKAEVYYVRAHLFLAQMVCVEGECEEEKVAIRLTEDHLLYIVKQNNKKNTNQMKKKTIPSYLVKEGDEILVHDESNRSLKRVKVSSVTKYQKTQQVFSVLTTKHNLFVNGMLASCYQTNHTWEKIDALPMRMLFGISPSIMKSESYQKVADKYDDFVEVNATRIFRWLRKE